MGQGGIKNESETGVGEKILICGTVVQAAAKNNSERDVGEKIYICWTVGQAGAKNERMTGVGEKIINIGNVLMYLVEVLLDCICAPHRLLLCVHTCTHTVPTYMCSVLNYFKI